MCRNLAERFGSVIIAFLFFSFLKALYSDIIYIFSILQRTLLLSVACVMHLMQCSLSRPFLSPCASVWVSSCGYVTALRWSAGDCGWGGKDRGARATVAEWWVWLTAGVSVTHKVLYGAFIAMSHTPQLGFCRLQYCTCFCGMVHLFRRGSGRWGFGWLSGGTRSIF